MLFTPSVPNVRLYACIGTRCIKEPFYFDWLQESFITSITTLCIQDIFFVRNFLSKYRWKYFYQTQCLMKTEKFVIIIIFGCLINILNLLCNTILAEYFYCNSHATCNYTWTTFIGVYHQIIIIFFANKRVTFEKAEFFLVFLYRMGKSNH